MAKKRPKAKQPPPKVCLFCGGRPLSHEHFWPDWSAPYLPKTETHIRAKSRGYVTPPGEKPIRDWQNQGHVGVITLRVVCENCNNGWMSREEERVRPILESILQGQTIMLTPDMQNTLAEYIAMKVMVADHSFPEHAAFSPDERREMYECRKIPIDLTITIFAFTSPLFNVSMYNREQHLAYPVGGRPWDGPSSVNFTYRFGSMFVQAWLRRGSGTLPPGRTGKSISLHPHDNQTRRWPPIIEITESYALTAQHIIQTIEERFGDD